MPSFVVLGKYSEQGMKGIKDAKARTEATKQVIQDEGGRMIFYYLTLGRYDFVSVVELPDAETAARILLAAGARGDVSTETLQAFTEDETWALVESLS